MKDKLHEQLAVARRDQILDAAAAVFAEHGFHVTTIKDIAKAAEIADGTIYNHFANKTALMIGILERLQETLQPDASELPPPNADLRDALRVFLSYPLKALHEDHFELFRIVMSEIMVNDDLRNQYRERIHAPTLEMAQPYFRQLAAQHSLDPARADVVLRSASALVFGFIIQSIVGDETVKQEWDRLPDVLADLLLNGLTATHT
jgi:TetR/AcrR family fatty acid metabolism transcriptional regulator